MYVLDTNVISELRSGKPKQSSTVVAWANSTRLSSHYLTSITTYELELGILQFERRHGASHLRTWFSEVIRIFQGRILPFTDVASLTCARMHVPNPKSLRDSMIAAITLEQSFTLVTRNIQDFQNTKVRLLNPWD